MLHKTQGPLLSRKPDTSPAPAPWGSGFCHRAELLLPGTATWGDRYILMLTLFTSAELFSYKRGN